MHRIRVSVALAALLLVPLAALAQAKDGDITEGSMRALRDDGAPVLLPLEHTDVKAEVSGFVSRVQVVQTFQNPFTERIEAVYVFPLPDKGAVDSMTLEVGQRTIKGEIKKREEARQLYEAAKSSGHTAALLDQERPNVFTQSVANILPGEKIRVTLTYVAPLEYDHGQYTFNFPMVVGPRYIPGTPLSGTPQGTGLASDTHQVPDASRISPPLLREGQRSGHDISLSVKLDAGVELRKLECVSHDVTVVRRGLREAEVTLKPTDAIPNKDFILRYDVAGEQLQAGILTHRDERGGYFTLMLQPQADFRTQEITAKEMFFVIDQSCSQSGLPMEKQKGIIYEALEHLNPADTFNIVTFNSGVTFFAPRALPNSAENVQNAKHFVDGLLANGGTEMLQGVIQSLDAPRDPERLRMILFLTDGYVGNDEQIIHAVEQHIGNARMFTYGVGSSVNHSLLDRMAEVGRGYYQYARVDEDTAASVKRFYDRIARPFLVDISVDYGDLGVEEVYPKTIRDLFASQPIILTGRYKAGGNGRFTLHGKIAGRPYAENIEVDLPRSAQSENEALASMFGRAKIEHLSAQQHGGDKPELVGAITQTALTYRLMSPYTSFVAVDDAVRTGEGAPITVNQAVPTPDGTHPNAFGASGTQQQAVMQPGPGKKALMNFTDVSVTGELTRPEGSYSLPRGGGQGFGTLVHAPKVLPPPAPVARLKEEASAPEEKRERHPVATSTARDDAARAVVEIHSLLIRGPRSRGSIEPGFVYAVEQALRALGKDANATGDLTVKFTVAADGTVRGLEVVHDGVHAVGLLTSLTRQLEAMKLGSAESESAVVVRLTIR